MCLYYSNTFILIKATVMDFYILFAWINSNKSKKSLVFFLYIINEFYCFFMSLKLGCLIKIIFVSESENKNSHKISNVYLKKSYRRGSN